MSRQEIRQMKRLQMHGRRPGVNGASLVLAQEASLQLLERSIRFGHGRLSLLKLAMAVQSGAVIPHEHWRYCQHVASVSKDAGTQALFQDATRSALIAPSAVGLQNKN